jgi:hypothetical protein
VTAIWHGSLPCPQRDAPARGVGVTRAPKRGTLRLRLRVRWRRQALTEALAAGADPRDSAELAILASRLTRTRTRHHLAEGLDRLLRASGSPPRPSSPVVPVNRRRIAAVWDQLAALAERLRDPNPAPAQTVALAAALLQDGGGPLYGSGRAATGADTLLMRRLAAQPTRSRRPERRFQTP